MRPSKNRQLVLKHQNSPLLFWWEEVFLIASLKIEVELVYSVPGVQQNNSVIYVLYIYICFGLFFHHRLLY